MILPKAAADLHILTPGDQRPLRGRQLAKLTDCDDSASDSSVSDLAAGNLTRKLSDPRAYARGRQ